ncbi:MAG: ABC transporter substrate-binding protein [Xanthobacteraceae bacterium]
MAASSGRFGPPLLFFAPAPSREGKRPERRGPQRRRPFDLSSHPGPGRRERPSSPRRAAAKAIITAIAAALLLLGPLIARALAADLVRVGNVGAVAFSFVPTNVGKEAGIFARNGLDIQISGFAGDAKLQQAMAAGAIDVGLGSGPGMAFIAKGSPVKAIAAIAGPPLIFALVVRTDGSVRTIDDLKGRKVGISTVGSATSWLMHEVSRQQGWGLDGFEQVPIGDNAARLAALKAGSIDGCVVDIGSALNFAQRDDGRILMHFGKVAKNFIMHVIFATDQAMAQKPADLRAFVKGWFESVAYMRAHKGRTVRIAMTVMHTDAKTTGAIYDELMPMFTGDGHFDAKALAVLRRSFVEMKILPSEPDMSKLYTEAFLPKS